VQDWNAPGEYGKAFMETILKANWADAASREYSVDFELLKSKMLKSGS